MQISRLAEASTTSVVTEIPSKLEARENTGYNETKTMYEKFWSKCQDNFVFKVDKLSISINQMYEVPKDKTIHEYEEHRMNKTLHFLCQMLDLSICYVRHRGKTYKLGGDKGWEILHHQQAAQYCS